MDSWGFENKSFTTVEPNALLSGWGSGGTNPSGKSDKPSMDPIAPHLEERPVERAATQDNPSEIGKQHDFWINFTPKDKEGLDLVKKWMSLPNSKKLMWSYKLKYTEKDGIAGISCKEEAKEALEQIEALAKQEELSQMNPTAPVEYFVSDGDKSGGNKDGKLDVDATNLSGIRSMSDNGATSEDNMKKMGTFPASLFEQDQKEFQLRDLKGKLDKLEHDTDEIFDFLRMILAAGNIAGFVSALYMLLDKGLIKNSQFADKLTKAMKDRNVGDDKIRQKVYDLLKKKSPTGAEQGEIRMLMDELTKNGKFIEALESALKDSIARLEKDSRNAEDMGERIRRMDK